jgi:phosphatidylinositol glycan class N
MSIFGRYENWAIKSLENSLLGLDTNGHGHLPHSKEYLENIQIVDKGLRRVEKLIQDFYQDDKTAFIMSADHGMSNRGSFYFLRP